MNTEQIEPIFSSFISAWVNRLKSYYSNNTFVITDKGEHNVNSFIPVEKRIEICDSFKEDAFNKLNDTEKEIYLKTDDKVLREKYGLVEKTNLPSSLSYLAEQDINVLESHKVYLLNQLFEIETLISLKKKIESNTDTVFSYEDDEDDEPWMK